MNKKIQKNNIYFEYNFFCKITNVFTVTSHQFNVSLLNTFFFQKINK